VRADEHTYDWYRRTHADAAAGWGAGGGFTAAGAAAFAAFVVALRTASRASCLAAMSFASAPTGSADAPSRVMRWFALGFPVVFIVNREVGQ